MNLYIMAVSPEFSSALLYGLQVRLHLLRDLLWKDTLLLPVVLRSVLMNVKVTLSWKDRRFAYGQTKKPPKNQVVILQVKNLVSFKFLQRWKMSLVLSVFAKQKYYLLHLLRCSYFEFITRALSTFWLCLGWWPLILYKSKEGWSRLRGHHSGDRSRELKKKWVKEVCHGEVNNLVELEAWRTVCADWNDRSSSSWSHSTTRLVF